MVKYVPQQGDIVVLNFDPQSGHEQKGRCPVIILSNHVFNKHLGLAFACPITNDKRDFPFHIAVESEQMKSIDYKSRSVKFVEKANDETLQRILGNVDGILGEV